MQFTTDCSFRYFHFEIVSWWSTNRFHESLRACKIQPSDWLIERTNLNWWKQDCPPDQAYRFNCTILDQLYIIKQNLNHINKYRLFIVCAEEDKKKKTLQANVRRSSWQVGNATTNEIISQSTRLIRGTQKVHIQMRSIQCQLTSFQVCTSPTQIPKSKIENMRPREANTLFLLA